IESDTAGMVVTLLTGDFCAAKAHSIPEWEHMTDNTTETNETEPERDDVEPTEEPETGTDTEHADDNSEDAAEHADSSTPTSGDGEDVDWRAKAELYKAQMRKTNSAPRPTTPKTSGCSKNWKPSAPSSPRAPRARARRPPAVSPPPRARTRSLR